MHLVSGPKQHSGYLMDWACNSLLILFVYLQKIHYFSKLQGCGSKIGPAMPILILKYNWLLTPLILKLETSPSGFKLLRYRVKNVVFTAGLLLQWFVRNFRKTDFVFQIPAYLQQCLLKVGGDLKD